MVLMYSIVTTDMDLLRNKIKNALMIFFTSCLWVLVSRNPGRYSSNKGPIPIDDAYILSVFVSLIYAIVVYSALRALVLKTDILRILHIKAKETK